MSPTSAQSAFAAFISRDFRLLTLNQCCLTFAVLIQEVLVAFHLYQITKNPLMLGLVGLMDFLPFLTLSLWGGYIADRFNRQRILQISFSLSIPLSLALWLSFDSFHTQHISSNVLLITTFSILLVVFEGFTALVLTLYDLLSFQNIFIPMQQHGLACAGKQAVSLHLYSVDYYWHIST